MTQTLTTEQLKNLSYSGGIVGDLARELLANREAQPVTCDIERIKRHALPAGECPKQSQVVLLSSLKRLLTAPPAPAVPDERHAFESFVAQQFGEAVDRRRAKNGDNEYMAWDMAVAWIVWQRRAAMLAQPQIEPQNIPNNIPDGLAAAVNRLLDSDGSRGCFSAVRSYDAREEIERLLVQPVSQGCEWTYDEHDYKWDSGCGEAWMFSDGSPTENGVKFCQGCGKPVLLAAAPEGGN